MEVDIMSAKNRVTQLRESLDLDLSKFAKLMMMTYSRARHLERYSNEELPDKISFRESFALCKLANIDIDELFIES